MPLRDELTATIWVSRERDARRRAAGSTLRAWTLAVAASMGAATLSLTPSIARAEDPDRAELERLAKRLDELERRVASAQRTASKDPAISQEELARLLVRGQLMLADANAEQAAFTFLYLAEEHGDSAAGAQAMHWLGRALAELGMEGWAFECFVKNLADARPDAQRLHVSSVAQMLRVVTPAQARGFARRPGLSATPEVRARLRALGLPVTASAPASRLAKDATDKARGQAAAIPPENQSAELIYELARHLQLSGEGSSALATIDGYLPFDTVLVGKGREAATRLRLAYFAGTIALAGGDVEAALLRFRQVQLVRSRDKDMREIVDLAWLAEGRIQHDAGEVEAAVAAYRRLSRDSPYFAEALYETVWTLLKAKAYERSEQALELLILHDPRNPLMPELVQLRGKLKIAKRDFAGAEEAFLETRRSFDSLRKSLGRALESRNDAVGYFTAVAAQDLRHFKLDAVMPSTAAGLARALPRPIQGERLARELGTLDQELLELDDLLARMQRAVVARERSRLFADLATLSAAMDGGRLDAIAVQDLLWQRARARQAARFQEIEAARKRARAALDVPISGPLSRDSVQARVESVGEELHLQDLQIAALEAQLEASERFFESDKAGPKVDPKVFLEQAAELRGLIGELKRENQALRMRASAESSTLRFDDPWAVARRLAMDDYEAKLAVAYASASEATAQERALFERARAASIAFGNARQSVDQAAQRRLTRAMAVIAEESINLRGYRAELDAMTSQGSELVGELMAATYRDVIGEVSNQVVRSEVGMLDVAWGVQEAEAEEIRRLESDRARSVLEIEATIDAAFDESRGEGPQ